MIQFIRHSGEKVKTIEIEIRTLIPKIWGWGKCIDRKGSRENVLGNGGHYTTVWVCQNSTNYIPKRANIIVCKYKVGIPDILIYPILRNSLRTN